MTERDKEYYNQKISELYSVIENQEKIVRDLQERINQYENPEDLTLFYMWIDNKAKDKMKELETEIFGLNDRLSCANEKLDLYKNVIDEVREYIFDIPITSVISNTADDKDTTYYDIKLLQNKEENELLEILDKVKGSDNNE